MLLNCHTYFSLRYGTRSVKDLLTEAKQKGYDRFVLADINNTSACVDAVRESTEMDIKVIGGIDFRNGIQQVYVGIAKNNNGFKHLNAWVSQHLHEKKDFDSAAPAMDDVYFIYPLSAYKGQPLSENEFVGVSIDDLKRFAFLKTKPADDKLVALQPATFTNKKSFNAHRLLRAIDVNTVLSKLPANEQASADHIMHEKYIMYGFYSNFPVLIENTERILDTCSLTVEYSKFSNKNLNHYTGTAEGDVEKLRKLVNDGLEYRYENKITDIIQERVERELKIIFDMGFASYFLINWDIVNYARSKNYYYVGRGSGANSFVAFLLRITDVDPIKLDLYFERFINPYRTNPPDFDIDFSWTDRDDITKYIFDTFGKNGNAALLGTYATFQSDAVIRELGKVFGLPPDEIDELQKKRTASKEEKYKQLILNYSNYLHNFPSHISIHASGILISQEPIHTYVSTFLPPKNYPTTHFSMIEAEDIGLYKFDILSQRGLGKIKDTLSIVKENYNIDIDIHDMRHIYEDERIKKALRSGNAIGCFYVESPGMRMLLCKLQADDYLRLVAASSIIRPGVAKSGMMREYILRYRNETKRDEAREKLPELYDILKETYGVMVYQEDVIKVAHMFADLSLAEADYLRRGMSWKFKQRNEFWRVREQFFNNCRKKGCNEKVIEEIWTQIESFANFAFSKGHSASYAVESYQALFLKAYYPIEYMAATLNNGGGFYRSDVYVHEARLYGATIELPCVNKSTGSCCVYGKTIFLGLNMVAELTNHTIELILAARENDGEFKDLPDFTRRVPASVDQVCILIRAGAFKFTGKPKQTLLWDVHMLLSTYKPKPDRELFHVEAAQYELPPLQHHPHDDVFDEMELFGFTRHLPFDMIRGEIPSQLRAADLRNNLGQTVSIVGYLVHVKHTNTSKGDKMFFGTFLDQDGQWIDTVHFPKVAKEFPFTGNGCYLITGKVTFEFDFYSLEVSEQRRLPFFDRDNAKALKKKNDNMKEHSIPTRMKAL
ncbi:MAG TPA: DNA polymerase III subunit alpha [Flavobacteriales bacterium]|nr:DNA polymerase III subunit alpha [Flavobacteriales bacterium]